jgi:hypothetical protein
MLHAALTAMLAAMVWLLSRPAGALVGRILAAAAALSVGTGYWASRPFLIALVLFALVIWMTETEGASPWLLLPVMWVWVNVHGSWPFAFGYLLLRMVARSIERRPLGGFPKLLGTMALGTLLGAGNPFGIRLLGYPLIVLTHHHEFANVVEWQSPSFSDPTNALFLVGALAAFIMLVVRRGSLEDALVGAVFSAAALYASRNVPVASLVLVPVLARCFEGIGTVDGERRSVVSLATTAALTALGVVIVSAAFRHPAYQLNAYPVDEVTWMQQRGLIPGRVATQDFVGNYLEYRFGTRASAFIDDRVDMYPSAVERAYGVLLGGAPGWQGVLDRYRVDAVLWARNEPLASILSESADWHVVSHDNHWIVAVRSTLRAGSA